MTRAWDKENIWVPDRNQTHDLPNTWRGFYTLSYENSWRTRSFNWVHMWQAFSILQGSALLSSSWVVISEWIWQILSSVMKCERWIISGTPTLVSCWIIHLSCSLPSSKCTIFFLIMQIILYIFSYYIKPYLKCYFYHSCLPQYFLVCYLYSLHTPFCLVHLSKFCCMTMTNHLLLKMKFYPSDLQQICEWEPGNKKQL